MKKISVFKLLCLAIIVFFSSVCLGAKNGKPNILFIFTDDHSTQTIGAYKDRFAKFDPTPNIDKLAEQGMLFKRCYVTNSICGPSRAAILTGKYSHLNGFYKNDMVFDGSQVTFPKLLQQGGYQTAVIGKWHLSSEPTGFDHYEVLTCWGGQGKYFNPEFTKNGEKTGYTGHTSEVINDLTMQWLKNERDPSKPFMLMFQHKAPHRGWHPAQKYHSQYAGVEFPEPDTLFDDYESRGSAAKNAEMRISNHMSRADLKLKPTIYIQGEDLNNWHSAYDSENNAFHEKNLKGKELVRWKYQRYVREYLRCISSVDEGIGQVLDFLEETGLDENTIVIYSSDQGFFMGEHGWYDKRFMYEESLRTPLIVKWPQVIGTGIVNEDTIVSNLDFAATFLDMAGIDIPIEMQGRSMVPVLKGEIPSDWRTSFYYHYYGYPDWHLVQKHRGVTDGRYKLIEFYELGESELYDLEKDPSELKNQFANPEYEGIRENLTALLREHQSTLKVPEDKVVEKKFKHLEGVNTYLKFRKNHTE